MAYSLIDSKRALLEPPPSPQGEVPLVADPSGVAAQYAAQVKRMSEMTGERVATIVISQSPKWGVVWRADVIPREYPDNLFREICWRMPGTKNNLTIEDRPLQMGNATDSVDPLFTMMFRSFVILVALLAFTANAPAKDSRIRDYVSPDGQTRLSAVAVESADPEAVPEFDLRLSRKGQPTVTIDAFGRDIDVYGRSDSKYVAVTDWIGSNVADCYVVAVTAPDLRSSMSRSVPKLPENGGNSHYYVSCQGWESSRRLRVMVSGHPDYPPFHDFNYKLIYDVDTHRMVWRQSCQRRPPRSVASPRQTA